MTASLTLEAGLYGVVALGSFYKLDDLETNANHRPNSVVAFGLIIAWLTTGIAALALAMLAVYHEAPTYAGWWVIFCAIVLTLLTHAAKVGGLLNGACGKAEAKTNSQSSVCTVVVATVASADDDDVLAGDIADRIREREFKAMRPVSQDTDEYDVALGDAPDPLHHDADSLTDVQPGGVIGHKAK